MLTHCHSHKMVSPHTLLNISRHAPRSRLRLRTVNQGIPARKMGKRMPLELAQRTSDQPVGQCWGDGLPLTLAMCLQIPSTNLMLEGLSLSTSAIRSAYWFPISLGQICSGELLETSCEWYLMVPEITHTEQFRETTYSAAAIVGNTIHLAECRTTSHQADIAPYRAGQTNDPRRPSPMSHPRSELTESTQWNPWPGDEGRSSRDNAR